MKSGNYRVLMRCDRPMQYLVCGCTAIVSDRVSAKVDLVRDEETGWVYRALIQDDSWWQRMADAAKERLKTWTLEMNLRALIRAVQIAQANPNPNNDRPPASTQVTVTAEKQ
jgi:hypothetical protein